MALVIPSPTVPLSGENEVMAGAPGGSTWRLRESVAYVPLRICRIAPSVPPLVLFGRFTAVIVSAETVLSLALTV